MEDLIEALNETVIFDPIENYKNLIDDYTITYTLQRNIILNIQQKTQCISNHIKKLNTRYTYYHMYFSSIYDNSSEEEKEHIGNILQYISKFQEATSYKAILKSLTIDEYLFKYLIKSNEYIDIRNNIDTEIVFNKLSL